MSDETGLAAWDPNGMAAAIMASLTAHYHDIGGEDALHFASAALAWVDARLADPATVEAVARALVLATEDDCDGYLPLTARDVDTLSVPRREEAAAALAAVRGLLGVTGGEAR